LLCFVSISVSAQGTGETNGYRLVWQDLFDGGTLNPDNWNIEVNGNGGGNAELQFYRAENVSIGTEPVTGNSCLVLTTRKETFSSKPATSGRINTEGKMSFKHGKIEASIKLPKTANGLWPAFWMLGADHNSVGWPKCGEIDILEMGERTGINAGTQDRYFSGACHWGEIVGGGHPNYGVSTTNSSGMQDDFHLFTLIWDNNNVKMYLDLDKYPQAAPYYNMDISDAVNPNLPGYYLHKPFYVIFNLAVGGNFPQIWDVNQVTALNVENGYTAKMYVDFVKIYQKEGDVIFTNINPAPEIQSRYSIYPDPSGSKFRITGPETPENITIINSAGQITSTFKNTYICDISGLPAGVYLVRIKSGETAPETLRIIKR
jgi:beta-glucanase (GH16 family)